MFKPAYTFYIILHSPFIILQDYTYHKIKAMAILELTIQELLYLNMPDSEVLITSGYN